MAPHFIAAEVVAIIFFVKERRSSEFGELGVPHLAWNDLEREWEEKGFGTTRTASVLGQRY